jgi:hypothetical protein
MKKLLLTFSFTVAALAAFAQYYGNDDNAITFGISGGSNFAYMQVKSQHRQDIYTDATTPFSLGLNADFKFNDYFSIRPAIFYSGKGAMMNAIYSDLKGNNTSVIDEYKLHYLEVPLDFIGHIPVGEGANIFLGGGPYFSWGLNGTNNQTLYTDDPVKQKISFGKNGDFKSTDYGATTVLGFQGAKGWAISGNIDWGFNNILQTNNTAFDATQLKTITFYISFGQSFR